MKDKYFVKFYLTIAFAAGLCLWSCKGKERQELNKDLNHKYHDGKGTFFALNSAVENAFMQYVESSRTKRPKIYKLVLDQRDKRSFRLTSMISQHDLQHTVPLSYMKIGEELVFVYTGLEKLVVIDSAYTNFIKKLAAEKLKQPLLVEKEAVPPLYDPPVWRITMTGDSVWIDKTVYSPDVEEPVESTIDFKNENRPRQ
jgi:hypothetical protein